MRIQSKLFATFFLSSVFLTVTLIAFIQWSIGKGMIDYVNAKELEALQPVEFALLQQYQKQDSWSSIEQQPKVFFDIIHQQLAVQNTGPNRPANPPPRQKVNRNRSPINNNSSSPNTRRAIPSNGHSGLLHDPKGGPPPRPPPPRPPLRYGLLDQDKAIIVGRFDQGKGYSLIELKLSDAAVGYLVVPRKKSLTDGYELNFVKQQNSTLLIFASVLLLLPLLIVLPLARHIIKPIKLLASGMNDLTKGKFDRKLALKRQDEFNTLERDFNELANTLGRNENARKRWLADVSHELRTPVAVLKGEIEAVIDGIRPLDINQFLSAQEEIQQLERLIEDLHELTRSDIGTLHYQKNSVDFATLISEESQKFAGKLYEKGLQLKIDVPEYPVVFDVDEKRIKQLIRNLILNILRYAQGADVTHISLTDSKITLDLVIEDNGPGVPDEQLERIFDHLFRVEESRNQKTGGSGLGLSICSQIVKAHGGTISASKSKLGGLAVHMHFNYQSLN
jgi:two-component system sensor histidine kinase BaeS